ncbi:DNA polymerase III subunit gamma/tau [Stratiformator vulcanicus]|uniref:DNA polymerase III subunit gamma/tau n=1 Tax=Stratiformator vulcanicus TaxID=2527980 RepID=UPI002877D928|nr:DNA polymerase III subunit gamma/tau [Stratiformator vulcanicus]
MGPPFALAGNIRPNRSQRRANDDSDRSQLEEDHIQAFERALAKPNLIEADVEPSRHYTVLARRYRPQTFDEVVGQSHVAGALLNAIRKDRVAHAYLFTGARGVGKTSTARIFAKALNCPNVVDGVPCNDCDLCQAVSAGSDVDVIEIDGASNNGVEDVRSLRANVNVKSMRSRYKVYIIDEVHMLSRGAFNALLKTLEEPPPGVKFVFCTTEPTKVPDTIRSRCQRFDFGTVDTQKIVLRLKEIATAEGFEVEAEALELVARRAGGSMRDSQSLFDQLLAFGGDVISVADVNRLFGTASDDRLTALIAAAIESRPDNVLRELDEALVDGVQIGELIDQVVAYLRDLMLLAAGAETVGLSSVGESQRPALLTQAKTWGLDSVTAALQIAAEVKLRMARVAFGRTLVELALVRMASLGSLDDLGALIASLKNGEAVAVETSQNRIAAPAPPRKQPPQPAANEPGPQKKSDESVEKSPEVAPAGRDSTDFVRLQAGQEEQLKAQLVSESVDAIRAHLQTASIAILGPDHLELVFPKSYSFGRAYFDDPPNRARFEKHLESLTGKPVRVTARIDDSKTAEPPSNRSRPKGRSSRSELLKEIPDDPFLQDAVRVFDVREVRRLFDA